MSSSLSFDHQPTNSHDFMHIFMIILAFFTSWQTRMFAEHYFLIAFWGNILMPIVHVSFLNNNRNNKVKQRKHLSHTFKYDFTSTSHHCSNLALSGSGAGGGQGPLIHSIYQSCIRMNVYSHFYVMCGIYHFILLLTNVRKYTKNYHDHAHIQRLVVEQENCN